VFKIRKLARAEAGQGMTEYIIVVALIAVAAIGVITVFSQNLRALFAASSNELAGSQQTSAQSAGGVQQTKSNKKNMGSFGSSSGT
jgi:pilus assembly protein Flp/PilA